MKRATSVSVGADYTLLLSAVSHPPLPLSDCEIYRTLMVDPVPQGRVEEGGEGFNDQETTDLVGLEEENTPSHRASYEVSEVINKEKAAGEEEKEDDGTIPSLFAICQRQVAKTVNTKTVLSSLNFADNFDAQLLSAYCTEYTQM